MRKRAQRKSGGFRREPERSARDAREDAPIRCFPRACEHALARRNGSGTPEDGRNERKQLLKLEHVDRWSKFFPQAEKDACFLGRLRPAQAAEVVSSNIVGYNKLAVTANAFEILGAQFTSIGDTDIDIQDLIVDGVAAGDNLLFFNGTGYDSYTYSDETYSEDWSQQLGPGWLDDEVGTRATRDVKPGEGFWIRPVASETITAAGEVSVGTTYTFAGNDVNKLVAIPVPMKVDLQNVDFKNIAAGDTIQTYNGSGYNSYTYSDETYSEDWSQQLGPGWLDDEVGTRSSREVDIGKGFWIKAASAEIEIGLSAD